MAFFKVDNKWNLAEKGEVVMGYVIYGAAATKFEVTKVRKAEYKSIRNGSSCSNVLL